MKKTAEEILENFESEYFQGEVFGESAYKYDVVLEAMEEHASQFKTKWIRVNDEMPKPLTPVLVFGKCCDKCDNIKICDWENGTGWYDTYSGDGLNFTPTHWMPLPEKPEQ